MIALVIAAIAASGGVSAQDKGYLKNGCDTVTMDNGGIPTNISQPWSPLYLWTFSVSNGCSPDAIVEVAMLFGPSLVFNQTLPVYGGPWQGSLSGGQLGFTWAIGWVPMAVFGGAPIVKGQTIGGFGFALTTPHGVVHWGTYVIKNGAWQLSGEGGFNL